MRQEHGKDEIQAWIEVRGASISLSSHLLFRMALMYANTIFLVHIVSTPN